MATTAEIQAQLDPTQLVAKIVQTAKATSAVESQYVLGGIGKRGLARWINTNVASSASAQAAAIIAALV